MSFRPVSIPLGKGLNQSTSDFALGANDMLAATNVVFTQGGAVRGRPGTVSQDAAVVGFGGPSTGPSLSTPFSKYQFAGMHTDAAGNLFAQCHGRLFKRIGAQWLDVGPLWSVRRKTYTGITVPVINVSPNLNGTACLDMGVNFTNAHTPGAGAASGAYGPTVYNADGSILGPLQRGVGQGIDTQLRRSQSVANLAQFWPDLANVRMQIVGAIFPASSLFLLATDFSANADTDYNAQRMWSAYDGTSYYVAYVAGVAPNDTITVLKVSAAGAVTGTLTFPTTSTVLSLCLAVDNASNKGLLVYTTTGGVQLRTEVLTLSTMTTLGIGVTATPFGSPFKPNHAVCGILGNTGYLSWCGQPDMGTNALEVGTRNLTTAAAIGIAALYDGTGQLGPVSPYPDSSFTYLNWRTVFPPTVLAGRVLLGIQACHRGFPTLTTFSTPGTWVVLDITDANTLTATNPVPVAAGEVGGTVPVTRAAVASVVNGGLLFGVPEGVAFNATGIDTAVLMPILLTPQAAPSVSLGPYLYFGGSLTYVYDGNSCYESNWVEAGPSIGGIQQVAGGGGTVNGASYTFAATWAYVDLNGRVHRSLPSRSITMVANAANNTLKINVNNPLFTSKKGTDLYSIASGGFLQSASILEIYAAGPNPGATDPLTLVFSGFFNPFSFGAGCGYTVCTITSPSNPSSKQLYTTGNVLADERTPSDRGMVIADNRIWTADEFTLYPSHSLVANVAPSWNNEVFPVAVPSAYGRIQGLCTLDDKVIAVCDSGTLMVSGPGLDNLGQGSGWSQPQHISSFGTNGPARAVCTHPHGGAFIGTDGLLYGVSRALVVQCMGQAVRDFSDAPGDLVYVPPGSNVGWDPSSNPLLVYGTSTLKVLDLATGLWCTWTGLTATSLAGATTGLIASVAAAPYVVQFSASGGLDLGVPFSMSIRLNPQEMAGNELMSGWGRLRSINPVFKTLGAHTVSVQAYADEQQIKIVDKSFTVGP